jgi:hypothetical protein
MLLDKKKFNHTYTKLFIWNTYLNEAISELADIINPFRMAAGMHSGIISYTRSRNITFMSSNI